MLSSFRKLSISISCVFLLVLFFLLGSDSVSVQDVKFTEENLMTGECQKKEWSIGELTIPAGIKYDQPSIMEGRTDVNSVTNWNAPLVWEGTFDPAVIDAIYMKMNPRVAVVVFAVGKYTRFLKGFIESGEKYFLVGFRVTYYIFTDNEKEVPQVQLGEGRKISILTVSSAKRWQEVVLGRMKWATVTIDKQIRSEADYLFMMDGDRFGAESLSRLSAVLHRGYYKSKPRDSFPYERRPESKAYIPAGAGDYYYTAAVWGTYLGYLEDMYQLVKYCYEQSEEDAKNNIEAVWQEESHLNKYLLYNKPTKVLSPEYLWSDYDTVTPDIKVVRVSQIRSEADYLFMMDVDRFGAESLSRLSAVLHRGYYKSKPRDSFPYERRPESKAYIPAGAGDYYYTAAVWGGYLEDMYQLVKYCYEQSEEDAKNNIEAVWQEESHLNKYLLYNKPTKVLSPEYLWSDYDTVTPDIKVVRVSQVIKDYSQVRPNGGH